MTSMTNEGRTRPGWIGAAGWLDKKARGVARDVIRRSVRRGAPPRWFGWRHVEPVPLEEIAVQYDIVDAPERAHNPLPANISAQSDLPDTRHWWGYSFRDVPERHSGETSVLEVADATIVSWRREDGNFYPAIVSDDGRAIDLREIKFRNGHAEALRAAKASGREPVHMDRAVWVLERVHDNHSHWLTAHLPKLILLKRMGLLDDALLPEQLTATQEASLRMLGVAPERFARYDESRPLRVKKLTIAQTDRFRPELLRTVRAEMAPPLPKSDRTRRVYVSRARARFRNLLNEEELMPMLTARGFERVFLEDLDFAAQVDLMRHAEAVVAPHGAGLTNVMFCAEGTHVVEIASPNFPNPNFYAVASAMGHPYYLIGAKEHGDVEPLKRDLTLDPARLEKVLDMIDADCGTD
ncbi:glycosyltransferase family 61 protein [Loktanella sp. SALINAS62]|uniref:glycosyltransferase family 61 protein n=1 Tax=Loktanella sp. SALINAS62 TaxID=2706124 RepID=UPI001B8D4F17|nr:glycosyltransferase family 61 protein [Loktanella sp. SALINAS62]MBS1302164.1 glycosyltransferase family 61 protein [Loktanella sp. SALINAS62]